MYTTNMGVELSDSIELRSSSASPRIPRFILQSCSLWLPDSIIDHLYWVLPGLKKYVAPLLEQVVGSSSLDEYDQNHYYCGEDKW